MEWVCSFAAAWGTSWVTAALLGQDAEEGLASASKAAEETGASIGEMEASVDTHRHATQPVMFRLAACKHGLKGQERSLRPFCEHVYMWCPPSLAAPGRLSQTRIPLTLIACAHVCCIGTSHVHSTHAHQQLWCFPRHTIINECLSIGLHQGQGSGSQG